MRLIFIVAAVMSGFVVISLVFFQATRKTYPGFKSWTAGVVFLTVGYLGLTLRGFIPDSLSIFVGNTAFPLGMVLHLDGLRRFLGLTRISKSWYAVPVVDLAAIAILYFLHDSAFWRSAVTAVAIAAPHWAMAALIFRQPDKTESIFYPVIGSLLGLAGLVILARPMVAFFMPQWHLLTDSPFLLGSLVLLIVLQLGEMLSLMMLNSERVESALVKAEAELKLNVEWLGKALDEQKRAEESLRESQERYRNFFDTSRDCVFMTTLDGRLTDFNGVALEVLGYAQSQREELLGSKVSELYTNPEQRQEHARIVAEKGFCKEYPIDIRKQDGTILHALITTVARRDPHGNTIGFQGTVRDITERKRVEEELQKGRAELQAIYEHAPVMMCVLDGQRQVLYANRFFTDFVGKPESELKEGRACGIFGCINALDDARGCGYGLHCPSCSLRSAIDDTYKTGVGHRNIEWRSTLLADGIQKEVVLLGSTALIKAGDRSSVLLCLQDVTDRERRQEILRQSEEKYRTIFEKSPAGLIRFDHNGVVTECNEAFSALIGTQGDRVIGFNLLTSIENQSVRDAVASALSGKTGQYEGEYTSVTSGKTSWVHLVYTPLSYADGSVLGGIGIAQDLTQRRQAEKALRQSRENYRCLVEDSPVGILSVDTEGRIQEVNQVLLNIMGSPSAEDTKAINVFELPELIRSGLSDLFRSCLSSGRNLSSEIPYTSKWGKTSHLRLLLTPLKDDLGNTRGCQAVVEDFSERKRLEEQIRQSQKMEAIGTLTGGIAHDFNNLLTIINGYTEMILMDRTEDDPIYADLQKILQTGQKGADMIQRLLSFTKQSTPKLEPVDLNERIQEAKKFVASTFPKMIEIETILADDLGTINADSGQIDQVLMNLCINARDAMPESGRLTLETRNMTVDEDYCGLNIQAKPGHYVLLEVSDTGVGISAETLERIFDPFFTTKGWDFRKGTGLGLPVVKGIVEQHGGWLTCRSETGKGTTFGVWLPVIEDSRLVHKPESPAATFPTGQKILLVDDEEHVRDLGKRILERAGYTVITASNGSEALDTYDKQQSNISLIVLDLMMPQMSGQKCLEELLKINPHVRVVVSTGHSLDAQENLLLRAVARGFVNKPYELKQMVQTVKQVLEADGPDK